MNWKGCYCWYWKWPLVWRKDAESRRANDVKNALQEKDKELREERATLQGLIGRVAKVGVREFDSEGAYTLNLRLDARWMSRGFQNRQEQAYFAEYVGREVEAQVARMVVVRQRERVRHYGPSDIAFPE